VLPQTRACSITGGATSGPSSLGTTSMASRRASLKWRSLGSPTPPDLSKSPCPCTTGYYQHTSPHCCPPLRDLSQPSLIFACGWRPPVLLMPLKLSFPPFFTLLLPIGDFTKLKSVSLSLCHIDLGALLSRCPSLRKLETFWSLDSIKVHSSTLQELIVYAQVELRTIDIATPFLSKCVFVARRGTSDEFSLLFSAPNFLLFSYFF